MGTSLPDLAKSSSKIRSKFSARRRLRALSQQLHTRQAKELLSETLDKFTGFIEQLSPEQLLLRDASYGMNFDMNWTCRPEWARGAYIFVSSVIASEIKEAFEEGELKKGHIVVSQEYFGAVKKLLSAQSNSSTCNRGARQPKLNNEEPIQLHPLSFADAARARRDVSLEEKLLDPVSFELQSGGGTFLEVTKVKISKAPSVSTRQTHTTGSRPRSQRAAMRSFGPKRKNFSLCKVAQPVACGNASAPAEQAVGFGVSCQNTSNPEVAAPCYEGQFGKEGQPTGQAAASGSNGDCGGIGHAPHAQSEPTATLDKGLGDADFYDAISEASVLTCETSLSVNEESQAEMSMRILSHVNTIFQDHMYLPGQKSNASAELEHVQQCIDIWAYDIVPHLLSKEPLEARVVNLAFSASVSLEHAQMGQNRLAEVVRLCCSKQVFSRVLHSVFRAEALATHLESAILPFFRKSNRQQRVSLNKIMAGQDHPESVHEVADLLRNKVATALQEAVSQVGVADAAREVLSRTPTKSAKYTFDATHDAPRRAAKGIEEEDLIHDHAAKISEKEDKRRKNAVGNRSAPGSVRGKPQVRHGRVTGIR